MARKKRRKQQGLNYNLEYIKSNYKTKKIHEIAQALSISDTEVRQRIQQLGLNAEQKNGRPFKFSQKLFSRAKGSTPGIIDGRGKPLIGEPHIIAGIDWLIFALITIASLAVYLITLSPGICAGDNGELTTAAYHLGNPHAPCYPLYCIVGKFFCNILPFLGTVAFRTNFMSAFLGALTVGFSFLFLLKLLGAHIHRRDDEPQWMYRIRLYLPPAAAALFLLFSEELWAQAVISEVYTLNSVVVPILMLIMLRFQEIFIENEKSRLLSPKPKGFEFSQPARLFYLWGFLWAFSVGDHHNIVGLLVPSILFFLYHFFKRDTFLTLALLIIVSYTFAIMKVTAGGALIGVLFYISLSATIWYFFTLLLIKNDNKQDEMLLIGVLIGLLAFIVIGNELSAQLGHGQVNNNGKKWMIAIGIVVAAIFAYSFIISIVNKGIKKARFLAVFLIFSLFIGAGLAVYLYMPIRAIPKPVHEGSILTGGRRVNKPPINWQNPDWFDPPQELRDSNGNVVTDPNGRPIMTKHGFTRFLDNVFRKQYSGFAQNENQLSVRIRQLIYWGEWRINQYFPILHYPWKWLNDGFSNTGIILLIKFMLIMPLVFMPFIPGAIRLYKRNRAWFWYGLFFLYGFDLFLILFNRFNFTPRDTFFAKVFFIPSYVTMTIFLAYGVEWLLETIVHFHQRYVIRDSIQHTTGMVSQETSASTSADSTETSVPTVASSAAPLNTASNITTPPPASGSASGRTSIGKPHFIMGTLITVIILIAAIAHPAYEHWKFNDLHNNLLNHNYGLNMLRTLEPQSYLLTEGGDNQVFTLLYQTLVERRRPDCDMYDQKGNVFERAYGYLMQVTGDDLFNRNVVVDHHLMMRSDSPHAATAKKNYPPYWNQFDPRIATRYDLDRPMYYTWDTDTKRLNEINMRFYNTPNYYQWQQVGILHRIVRTAASGKPDNFKPRYPYWKYYRMDWRKHIEQTTRYDYLAREIVANYNYQRGDYYKELFNKQRDDSNGHISPLGWEYYDRALEDYRLAKKYGHDMVAIYFNHSIRVYNDAVWFDTHGYTNRALEAWTEALNSFEYAGTIDENEVRSFETLLGVGFDFISRHPEHEANYIDILEKAARTTIALRTKTVDYYNKRFQTVAHLIKEEQLKSQHPQTLKELRDAKDNYRRIQQASNRIDALQQRRENPYTNMLSMETIARSNPADWQNIIIVVDNWNQRQDIERAFALMEFAYNNNRNQIAVVNHYAQFAYAYGEYSLAEKLFKELMTMQPRNFQWASLLGNTYFNMRNFHAAIKMYERAKQLVPPSKTTDLATLDRSIRQAKENLGMPVEQQKTSSSITRRRKDFDVGIKEF